MQEQRTNNVNEKSVKGEHRLLWLSSFIMILPTILVTRLLPTQWKYWSSGKSIFTVVRDAKAQASIIATMAFTAY
jgi:hypothetical protein